MKNNIYVLLLFITFIACDKDNESTLPPGQSETTGTVWVSGGLFYCHSQIRTSEGDTLIPMINGKNIYPYSMGQKVKVVYEKLENIATGCNNSIACNIITTELIE
jgi:hypothetical protein